MATNDFINPKNKALLMSNTLFDFIAGLFITIASVPNLGTYFALNISLIMVWLAPVIIIISLIIGKLLRYLTTIPKSFYLFSLLIGIALFFSTTNYLSGITTSNATQLFIAVSAWIASFSLFNYGRNSKM